MNSQRGTAGISHFDISNVYGQTSPSHFHAAVLFNMMSRSRICVRVGAHIFNPPKLLYTIVVICLLIKKANPTVFLRRKYS